MATTTVRDQITAQFAVVRSLIARHRGAGEVQGALSDLRDLVARHGTGSGPLVAAERLAARYASA